MNKKVKKYLESICPLESEQKKIGTLVILTCEDHWKIYWNVGHYMIFRKDGKTEHRELNAIYCLLLQHMNEQKSS